MTGIALLQIGLLVLIVITLAAEAIACRWAHAQSGIGHSARSELLDERVLFGLDGVFRR